MRTPRRTVRTAWLALCVTLLAALVPSLSAMLDPREGRAGWIEICTAQGLSRWIPSTTDGSDEPSRSAPSSHAACPVCAMHAAAPPPVAAGTPGRPPGRPLVIDGLAVADRIPGPAGWSVAQPRAPPRPHA